MPRKNTKAGITKPRRPEIRNGKHAVSKRR